MGKPNLFFLSVLHMVSGIAPASRFVVETAVLATRSAAADASVAAPATVRVDACDVEK